MFSKGTSTYLTVEISNKDDIRNAKQIELIDLYGNILVNEKIQPNVNDSILYSTIEKFQPPAKNFFFYIRVFYIYLFIVFIIKIQFSYLVLIVMVIVFNV